MKKITTVGELKEALEKFDDNDAIVIEIHEGERTEDLYDFYVDSFDNIKLADGTTISEVRLCI